MTAETTFLTLADRRIAYQQQSSPKGTKDEPGVIFLGGFGSDMMGSKACFLAERCLAENRPFLRFDYRGHGQSSDQFENGTIADWADDALQVLDRLTEGPQILIGSSMGGWIGLLVARARPDRVAGFMGIAAAPDFTEDLVRPSLTPELQAALERDGFIQDPTEPSGEGPKITKKLMDDGVNSLVLRTPLAINGPVALLQGKEDRDVPWKTALKIMEHVEAPSVRLTLVKDGTHRMSRPQDLGLIWGTLNSLRAMIKEQMFV